MPLAETGQIIPPEAVTPPPPPDLDNHGLELPESRVEVDFAEDYNPGPEETLNTWKFLEHIPAAKEKGEDLKAELIKSLAESDESITERARLAIQTRDDPEAPDAGEAKKIAPIFVLRKMLNGRDWRAAGVAEEAYAYSQEKKRQLVRERVALENQPPSAIISATIEKLRKDFLEITAGQKHLERTIQAGYPELWEKIKPAAPPEEKKIETAAEKAEKEHLARLEQVIAEKLPEKAKDLAPEIVGLLTKLGFTSTEINFVNTEQKPAVAINRTILFLDPLRADLPLELAKIMRLSRKDAKIQFTPGFKEIIDHTLLPGLMRTSINSLLSGGRWNYAGRKEAGAILRCLNERKAAPYAMYLAPKDGEGVDNLAAIEAKSKTVKYRQQADNKPPVYNDETTFFSSPVFYLDINNKE